MKKVLVIVHLPRASPRIIGLAKYLPEFGWEPIILSGVTPEHQDLAVRIIETPYQDALGFLGRWLKLNAEKDARQQIKTRLGVTARKSPLDSFLTLGGEFINYPCPDKNWQPFAIKAGRQLLQAEKIDAIISSSPPVISHLIARVLKDKHKIPWLADLRDLWSQNHNYQYSPLRRALDRRLELKTLSQADALTTVAEPLAEKLRSLHRGKPVYTITHGFDEEEVNNPPAPLTAKFTITYTGNIYRKRQNPAKLFAALHDLIADGTIDPDEIEVSFYGSGLGWLDREIKQYGLTSFVKQYEPIPQHLAVEKQRESQLLLLLDWDDPQEKGVYTGKIFEYLGARRPVLATGGSKDDVVGELLDETKAGRHAPTVEDVKKALKELYGEYKLKGEVAYNGLETEIKKYTQRETSRKFAEIIDHLITNNPPSTSLRQI